MMRMVTLLTALLLWIVIIHISKHFFGFEDTVIGGIATCLAYLVVNFCEKDERG